VVLFEEQIFLKNLNTSCLKAIAPFYLPAKGIKVTGYFLGSNFQYRGGHEVDGELSYELWWRVTVYGFCQGSRLRRHKQKKCAVTSHKPRYCAGYKFQNVTSKGLGETGLPYTSATPGFAIGCLIGRNNPAAGSQKSNTNR
jgi:hypothetical protein